MPIKFVLAKRPEKKYSVIYADPPWSYGNENTGGSMTSGASNQYPCMSIESISNLQVNKIADDNALLFMWVTSPFLVDGSYLKVIKAWGFEPKTMAFVWAKLTKKSGEPNFGMGFYTRSCIEYVVLAKRGKPETVSHSVRQLLEQDEPEYVRLPIRAHSEKPPEFRNRIVSLCGDVNRVELFARQRVNGWDAFGNQVQGSITLVR